MLTGFGGSWLLLSILEGCVCVKGKKRMTGKITSTKNLRNQGKKADFADYEFKVLILCLMNSIPAVAVPNTTNMEVLQSGSIKINMD